MTVELKQTSNAYDHLRTTELKDCVLSFIATIERMKKDEVYAPIFIHTGTGRNCIVLTLGFVADAMENPTRFLRILSEVIAFDDFNQNNDPYGEHDFGKVGVDMNPRYTVLWKIDDYRGNQGIDLILTIMTADEY